MLGYLFLGFAFGLMLNDAGYGFWWAFFISVFVYAGSMQFVLVTLLTAGASLWYTLIMTLFVNGRHMFYGLSFVEKFKKMGAAYPYMVFSLTDETFSLLCDLKVPEGMSEERVNFDISLLDHIYWIVGSCVGALAGNVLPFDTTGIDFAMTALFIVIVVNQWMEAKEHTPAIVGGIVGIIAVAAIVTLLIRAIPFVVFGGKREVPATVTYLGKVLPPAIMVILVIYCVKSIHIFSGSHGIPELLSIAVVAALHIWKKNTLLSIEVGTVLYMVLVQVVF